MGIDALRAARRNVKVLETRISSIASSMYHYDLVSRSSVMDKFAATKDCARWHVESLSPWGTLTIWQSPAKSQAQHTQAVELFNQVNDKVVTGVVIFLIAVASRQSTTMLVLESRDRVPKSKLLACAP